MMEKHLLATVVYIWTYEVVSLKSVALASQPRKVVSLNLQFNPAFNIRSLSDPDVPELEPALQSTHCFVTLSISLCAF